jgi:hypothetical protein
MDIFDGIVVPNIFVNQDGDPFLFQLYRRRECSSMLSCSLMNGVGGSGTARYVKQSAVDWTFETLDNAVDKAAQWLTRMQSKIETMLTIDIVIPCHRVDLPIFCTKYFLCNHRPPARRCLSLLYSLKALLAGYLQLPSTMRTPPYPPYPPPHHHHLHYLATINK